MIRTGRSLFFIVITLLCGACHNLRDLPPGISFDGAFHPVESVEFLADYTYVDEKGERHSEQQIFNAVFKMIAGARHTIVLDMFLFNAFQGEVREETRQLSGELTDALLRQKEAYPGINIVVITDPINEVYGGMVSPYFEALRSAGVQVVTTNLDPLRDSNPFYSAIWRVFFKPFGNSSEGSALANPFGEGRVSIRSYLSLLNFKANHRKVILADSADGPVGLVTSANPHDGSSAHSNIALQFSGPAVADLLASENAVLELSNLAPVQMDGKRTVNTSNHRGLQLRIVTEGKIKTAILDAIANSQSSDRLYLAMFYFSDRDIVAALIDAHKRGVKTQIVLDPNKDAFGMEKNGVPNRQVGLEFSKVGMEPRWCDTHGEQCHSKILLIDFANGESVLMLGSANYTRRNLDDYNLETNVIVVGPSSDFLMYEARQYMNTIYQNIGDHRYSTDFPSYEDKSVFRHGLYRFMEWSGMSTF